MDTLLQAILLALLYIALLVTLEVTKRKFRLSAEITRRIAHIFTGLCAILNFSLLPGNWFLSLVVISLVGTLISHRFGIFTAVHAVRRKTYGEVFLPIGTICAYLIASGDAEIFIPSILILTFADSFAGLVSDYLKQQRKLKRGSLVFFAVALTVLLATTNLNLGFALLVSVVLTLVERYSPLGSDNFTIPVAAAALLLLF